jgi:hypothetical protein
MPLIKRVFQDPIIEKDTKLTYISEKTEKYVFHNPKLFNNANSPFLISCPTRVATNRTSHFLQMSNFVQQLKDLHDFAHDIFKGNF